MRVKRVELTDFKRFTHLVVENIPESTKLVVLVGPNGSGKTSFMEAMNHFYKRLGYNVQGDYRYLSKSKGNKATIEDGWSAESRSLVKIDFYDAKFGGAFGDKKVKGHFYFRSAYRNDPDFTIDSMERQNDPTESVQISTLIHNDQTVSDNYQRIVANTIYSIYDSTNDQKTVEALREELIGKIRVAIERVFDDLKFSSIGNPLDNGSFYFTKGTVENFHYRNLSARSGVSL